MLYTANEKVLCFHGPLIYQAKVLKAEKWTGDENVGGQTGPHYLVHYAGWKQTWDEWVPESRLLKFNDDNLAKQKALIEARKAAASANASAAAAAASASGATSGRKSARDVSETADSSRKGKEARGTKRGRDTVETEEEYVKRPEIRINIPDSLKVRLVDDWENVTKKSQLVPLPREPTVSDIFDEYRKHYLSSRKESKARSTAVVDEVLAGLKLYFDKSLGNNLLYRFERAQYVDLRKAHTANPKAPKGGDADLEPSSCYGAEHLLRLFVNLPSIIAHTTMDADSINLLKEHLAEFLSFMAKEQKRLFVDEYQTPSAAYARGTQV